MALTRQTRKTIQAIRTDERVPAKSVTRLLEALDFKLSVTGSHHVWRHQKGYRIVFSNFREKTIWGYSLKDVRDLLDEIEQKEGVKMPIPESDHSLIDPKREEVKDFYDNKTLAERSFKNVTKLNTHHVPQPDQTNNQIKSLLRSIQDNLLDLNIAIENGLKAVMEGMAGQKKDLQQIYDAVMDIETTPPAPKPEDSITPKQKESLARIKKAWAEYPQLTQDDYVMAGIAKVDSRTYKVLKSKKLF